MRPLLRTCVFCGGSQLTGEHIFPRWLTSMLPAEEKWRGQDIGVGKGDMVGSGIVPRTHREMGQQFTD